MDYKAMLKIIADPAQRRVIARICFSTKKPSSRNTRKITKSDKSGRLRRGTSLGQPLVARCIAMWTSVLSCEHGPRTGIAPSCRESTAFDGRPCAH